MTYEPGVLVRRQQREYPPELRQEIALAALEVGNNREVARLYSERLGYTVNESTVRGIKKRYLEGVQKGKIDSPGLSPRAGDPSQSPRESEGEDTFQPEQVMKLQLEVLEGKMKETVGMENPEDEVMDDSEMADSTSEVNGNNSLVINDATLNGEDSRDSSFNQLSIDTGESESEAPKPTIRIAKGLQKDPVVENNQIGILAAQLIGSKRKSNGSNGVSGVPVKKIRPSAAETDAEIFSLEKEIRALQWLARRKEQEWDQAVRLLKQKEERLMKAQRNKVMIQTEAEHLLTKYRQPSTAVVLNSPMQPVIVPQQQVLILPTNQPVTPTSRLIQPKPTTLVSKPVITSTGSTTNTIIRSSKSPSPAAVQRQVTTTTTPDRPTSASAATTVDSTETKFSSVLEKASKNLQKASGATAGTGNAGKKEEKKNTPVCQGCGKKKSEFVCAGCSNRWYCSRECQVEDWDEHADDCSG